jgi:hypothetical protein
MTTLETCGFSEELSAAYASYKNGGRDREKLAPEQLATCFILESELIATALYYLLEKMENAEVVEFATSPMKVISNLDFDQITNMINILVKSRVKETNDIIDDLVERLSEEKNNGAE